MNISRKKIIVAVIGLVIVLCVIGFVSLITIQTKIVEPLNVTDNQKKEFVIESGEGVKRIAANLESENLIFGADYFEIYVWQKKISSKLQAGKYEISPSMTIEQMVNLFVGGKIIGNEVTVTIPEGYTILEIDHKLAQKGLISEGQLVEYNKNVKQDLISNFDFLDDNAKETGLQGFYFPDTYIYYKSSSLDDIVIKMLNNFDKKLTTELREEIKKQNKTVFEVVTLASIIEKEAGREEDMRKIASVFQNRLDIGQALESDATVNFVTESGRSQVTFEDTKVDSPYNTYKHKGLTPGPISNPGIKAIKAAIYPEKTDYFFFLTKKEDGKAIFGKTYQEHLINRNRYLD